jgi:hypothetical protein
MPTADLPGPDPLPSSGAHDPSLDGPPEGAWRDAP